MIIQERARVQSKKCDCQWREEDIVRYQPGHLGHLSDGRDQARQADPDLPPVVLRGGARGVHGHVPWRLTHAGLNK